LQLKQNSKNWISKWEEGKDCGKRFQNKKENSRKKNLPQKLKTFCKNLKNF